MNTISPTILTLDEITRRGQEIYFNELKNKLEQTHFGDYVVIEVNSKQSFIHTDVVTAVQKAKKKFPDSLFFIVQIGKLQASAIKQIPTSYAWLF